MFMYGHHSGNFVPVPEKSTYVSKFLVNKLQNFLNIFFHLPYLAHFEVKNKREQTGWRRDIYICVERSIV